MHKELAFKISTEEIATGRLLTLEWDEDEEGVQVEYDPTQPNGFELACIAAVLRYSELVN